VNNFKLSLPTDIPWRRIAVSGDMLDPILCDQDRPPSFRSSLAAFRFDPAEEYQPLEDITISYVKVVATLGPYAPEIPLDEPHGFLPPELVDDLEQAFPCYGAVLQVSVAPPAGGPAFSTSQYPYFIDFEPKKRELYEAVTDTGELLSGSSSTLSVGKSATGTLSTEEYDLDMGGSGGANLGLLYGLVSVGGSGSSQQQVGTVNRATSQTSNVQTSDASTERREVQSHTTQLTQMYNSFQAFHLGTNRAVFMIEPRPHIRQTAATFVNGPRALEGMQEVFLVVARPKTMTDFCVAALLETAHVTTEPVFEHEKAVHTWPVRFDPAPSAKAEHDDGKPDKTPEVEVESFPIPAGWELDTAIEPKGYKAEIFVEEGIVSAPKFQKTSKEITVSYSVRPWGTLHMDVTIYLRKKEATLVERAQRLFLSARDLCACPPKGTKPVDPHDLATIPGTSPQTTLPAAMHDWISFDRDIRSLGFHLHQGSMSRRVFLEGRRFSAAVHQEMIRSFNSSRRRSRGQLRYAESDAFHARLAGLLAASPHAPRLALPLADVPGIGDAARLRLERALGVRTVGDLLRADGHRVTRALGADGPALAELRRRAIGRIAEDPSALAASR
jgi:hypothetical protein